MEKAIICSLAAGADEITSAFSGLHLGSMADASGHPPENIFPFYIGKFKGEQIDDLPPEGRPRGNPGGSLGTKDHPGDGSHGGSPRRSPSQGNTRGPSKPRQVRIRIPFSMKYSGKDRSNLSLKQWETSVRIWLMSSELHPDSLRASSEILRATSGDARQWMTRNIMPEIYDSWDSSQLDAPVSPWPLSDIVAQFREMFVNPMAYLEAEAALNALRQDGDEYLNVYELSMKLEDLVDECWETTTTKLKIRFFNAVIPRLAIKLNDFYGTAYVYAPFDEIVDKAALFEQSLFAEQAHRNAHRAGIRVANYEVLSSTRTGCKHFKEVDKTQGTPHGQNRRNPEYPRSARIVRENVSSRSPYEVRNSVTYFKPREPLRTARSFTSQPQHAVEDRTMYDERRKNHLCYECGKAGHIGRDCRDRLKPKDNRSIKDRSSRIRSEER